MWHGGDRNYNPADNGSRVTCTSNTNVSTADRLILPGPASPAPRPPFLALWIRRRNYHRFNYYSTWLRAPLVFASFLSFALSVRVCVFVRPRRPCGEKRHMGSSTWTCATRVRRPTRRNQTHGNPSNPQRPRVTCFFFIRQVFCIILRVLLVNARQHLPHRLVWYFHRIYYYYYYYVVLWDALRKDFPSF